MNHQGEQPSLIGQTVWELVDEPERGGIAWGPLTTYAVGDMVSEGGKCYFAIVSSVGSTPSVTPTDWQAIERGGVAWLAGIAYEVGDVVTAPDAIYGTSMFRCITANTSAIGNEPDGSVDWVYASQPERGGIEWSDLGIPYIKGDIVTADHSIYGTATFTCILDHASTALLLPETSILQWKLSSAPERGGVLWDDGGIAYKIGDVVVADDVALTTMIFRCIVDNVSDPLDPPTSSTDWTYGYQPEKGGLLFQATWSYEVGQVITVVDPALPAPTDTELRAYTCHTAHVPGTWATMKTNWSDLASGGTF